jgi:hypothetical protein
MKFEVQILLISVFLMLILLRSRFNFAEDIYVFLKFITTFFIYSVTRDSLMSFVQVGDSFWYMARNILPFVVAIISWKSLGIMWVKWNCLKKLNETKTLPN